LHIIISLFEEDGPQQPVFILAWLYVNLVKVKFTLEQVYLYSFFNLGTRWGWVVNATPRPLYPRERDPVPIV
jgi:hypothetical protein